MAQNSSIFICSALQRPDRWKTRMEAEILSLWSAQAKAGSGIKDGFRLNAGFQECNTIFYKNMFKHPSFCIPTEVISVRHSHKPTWHRTVIYIFNWILDNKDIALCFKWLFRIWDKSFFFFQSKEVWQIEMCLGWVHIPYKPPFHHSVVIRGEVKPWEPCAPYP